MKIDVRVDEFDHASGDDHIADFAFDYYHPTPVTNGQQSSATWYSMERSYKLDSEAKKYSLH